VRAAAVKKLEDQVVLVEIARENTISYGVRFAAVESLKDQSVITEIARNKLLDSELRAAAVKNLEDQAVLAEIARNTSYMLQSVALSRIDDDTLAEMALTEYSVEALMHIKNRALLKQTLHAVPNSNKGNDFKNQAAEKMGGFICIYCKHINLPEPPLKTTCHCENCGKDQHDEERLVHEGIDFSEYYYKCKRCGMIC
jgi:hypothetical protein